MYIEFKSYCTIHGPQLGLNCPQCEFNVRNPVDFQKKEEEIFKMIAYQGDMVVTNDNKLSFVKSVEAGLKGKTIFHTSNGDYQTKDLLAIYRPIAVDNTPEQEPDATDKLAAAIEKLTKKLK